MEERHTRFKLRTISYRQGFIEVLANVHPGCVNLETLEVGSHVDLAKTSWVDSEDLQDDEVIASTELELSAGEAEQLAEALTIAARQARAVSGEVGGEE